MNLPENENPSPGASRTASSRAPARTLSVAVQPELLRWARERAGLSLEKLEKTFPKVRNWEAGVSRPTLRQLESFARKVHVPFGFLFLSRPPAEVLPVKDFRTREARSAFPEPSPELLDTLYLCQQRQDWYRNYLQLEGEPGLDFVGTVTTADDPVSVAEVIRERLRFDISARTKMPTWTEALRQFREQVEAAGVLVMSSSVVGNNTHRKLDPGEFRGFALVDRHAPLIFVNAADSKSGQMFTLAHELAHVWAGESGISDERIDAVAENAFERWCDRVAAELLVPLEALRQEFSATAELHFETRRLARLFKVSTLVVLRRLLEIGALDWQRFRDAYASETERLQHAERRTGNGGDFYATLAARVSRRFARAVITSALEGLTLFRDAYRLLGVRNPGTFRRLARDLGLEAQ